MSGPATSLRRWWPRLGWVAAGLLAAVYVAFPIAMGTAAVVPAHEQVGAGPTGFEEVSLLTDDGVRLAAWYRPPDRGATVLVVHGAGGSRDGMRRQAELLAARGYGVLSLDLRGHGESGGRTNRFGWEGTRDVKAAVAYLQGRPEVDTIGAWGSSLGAEVVLGATAQCPQIRAVVAEGATRRCAEELVALPSEKPLVRSFTARLMFGTVDLLSGSDPPSPLLDELIASDASVLLIAGGSDELEVAYNRLFAQALGSRARLWVATGAGHTEALTRHPDEYERRVVEFLDATLTRP